MGTRPPRPAAIAAALTFVLSVFCFTLFIWISFGGPVPFGAKGYRAHVLFTSEAANLSPNASVRISGIPVGKVISLSQRGEYLDAELDLESKYAPIPRNTGAIIRSKTLLGEQFVELTPGDEATGDLPDGGTLERKRVGAVQNLDDVLGSFDRPTREALKEFLADFRDALTGRGDDLNAVIGNAGPAAADIRRLIDVLDEQGGDVRRLLRDGGVTLDTIGRTESDVQGLITAADDVFGATAERNRELTATIDALPGFLSASRTALEQFRGVAAEAAPTLKVLRPVAPLLEPGLEEAVKLAPELRRVFRGLTPVLGAAEDGLPALSTILAGARPLVQALYPAGRELIPVVEFLGAYRQELVTWPSLAGPATQASVRRPEGYDHHYLRALFPITTDSLIAGFTQREPGNRANPYPAPGGLAKLVGNKLEAFGCAHTGNPATQPPFGPSPPCLVQAPWKFQAASRSFPHVTRDPG